MLVYLWLLCACLVSALLPTTSSPSSSTSSPSLSPTAFPTHAPSATPTRAPSQPHPFLPAPNINSTALNITLNIALDSVLALPDGVLGFGRNLKAQLHEMMNWTQFPYGPLIDVIGVQKQDSSSITLAIVMQESFTNELLLRLQQNNATNTSTICVGYLCQFSNVLSNGIVYNCPSVGWAPRCPQACHRDECAQSRSTNNQCILNSDWTTYTCVCLSMNYRTGANKQSCDPLDEASTAGVIVVAVTGFLAALLLTVFVWRRYAVYQQITKPKQLTYALARPQRVNTIGRISAVGDSPRPSGHTPSLTPSHASFSDNSNGSNKDRLSVPRLGLHRAPTLSPIRRASHNAKATEPKPVVKKASPELDPFNHRFNNKFQQMNFSGKKTRFSRLQALTVLCGATCALVPGGLGLIIVTSDIVRQEVRYDNVPECDLSNNPQGTICLVKMVVEQDMVAPIHVHYRLDSFFQNHRSYVMSRDEKQLRNADTPDSHLRNCDPLSVGYDANMQPPYFIPAYGNLTYAVNASAPQKKLYPCGLVAQSWFNDIFSACHKVQNETFCDPLTGENWDKQDIIYEPDQSLKFVDRPLRVNETKWNALLGYEMPSLDNEDFIVWMRVAPRERFSKMYRNILGKNLRAGDTLMFAIQNNFPAEAWNGKKSLVISTASLFGGKTTTLGQLYVVVGILSALFAVVLWLFGGPDAYYHVLSKNGLCARAPRHSTPDGAMRLD